MDYAKHCPDSDNVKTKSKNQTSQTNQTCNGAGYGTTCVECARLSTGLNQKGSRVSCDVQKFELPQQIDDSLASDWIQGFGDPEFIVYYERFPDGEDKYWQADMLSMSATVIAMSAGFNFVLGPGGGLAKHICLAIMALMQAENSPNSILMMFAVLNRRKPFI